MSTEDIGKRIKNIRIGLGKNMDDFGNLFSPNVTKGTISKWENGKYAPNNERLKRIAELGEVPIEYLLTGNHPIKEAFISSMSDSTKEVLSDLQKTILESQNYLTNNIDLNDNKSEHLSKDLELINKYFSKLSSSNAEVNFLEIKLIVENVLLINDLRSNSLSPEQQYNLYSFVTKTIKTIRNSITTDTFDENNFTKESMKNLLNPNDEK